MKLNTEGSIFNYPEMHIDLTNYAGKIFVKIGPCIYCVDVEKLVKDYGSLEKIIYDNKTEE